MASILFSLMATMIVLHSAAAFAMDTSASSLLYWQANLPDLNIPTELKSMLSPLTATAIAGYTRIYNQRGSLGNLCSAGNLYCNAEEFNVHREVNGAKAHTGPPTYYLLKMESAEVVDANPTFFREKELVKGVHLTLPSMPKQFPDRAFLPRTLADIVLSFGMDSIERLFKIAGTTTLAQEIAQTIEFCKVKKERLLTGEEAACGTSLESLVDLMKHKFLAGSTVEPLVSSLVSKAPLPTRVLDVQLKASESSTYASCHNAMYPSSLFYCHYIPNTRIYGVTLLSGDGSLITTVALCHLDTTEWNPKHKAFHDLNTVPGESEACHWQSKQDVTFVPKTST